MRSREPTARPALDSQPPEGIGVVGTFSGGRALRTSTNVRVDWALRLQSVLQCDLERIQEGTLLEWLAQERDGTGLERRHPSLLLREGCDENDGNVVALVNQHILQIEPAYARHLEVGDEAGCTVHVAGLQKLLCGFECARRISQRIDKVCRGISDHWIVIDD
jgi:hypothetical protein